MAILAFSLSLGIAAADNIGPRHVFLGDVFINGNPAPDGVLITAQFEGEDIAATTTYNGKYGYTTPDDPELLFVVPQSPASSLDLGDVVEFYVAGVYAANYSYESGGKTYLNLNVEIHPFCGDGIVEAGEDCNTCPADAGTCAPPVTPGGSPSGGPSGGSPPCEEEWVCSDWFSCFNNEQTRVCTDTHDCGTEKDKPDEKQYCVVVASGDDECTPGEQKCDGDQVLSCSPEGDFVVTETCSAGCNDGVCNTPPEEETPDETGGEIDTTTEAGSNPIMDFFNQIFGFSDSEGDGVTGRLTARSVTLGLFGAFIALIIIIALVVLVFGRRRKKE